MEILNGKSKDELEQMHDQVLETIRNPLITKAQRAELEKALIAIGEELNK